MFSKRKWVFRMAVALLTMTLLSGTAVRAEDTFDIGADNATDKEDTFDADGQDLINDADDSGMNDKSKLYQDTEPAPEGTVFWDTAKEGERENKASLFGAEAFASIRFVKLDDLYRGITLDTVNHRSNLKVTGQGGAYTVSPYWNVVGSSAVHGQSLTMIHPRVTNGNRGDWISVVHENVGSIGGRVVNAYTTYELEYGTGTINYHLIGQHYPGFTSRMERGDNVFTVSQNFWFGMAWSNTHAWHTDIQFKYADNGAYVGFNKFTAGSLNKGEQVIYRAAPDMPAYVRSDHNIGITADGYFIGLNNDFGDALDHPDFTKNAVGFDIVNNSYNFTFKSEGNEMWVSYNIAPLTASARSPWKEGSQYVVDGGMGQYKTRQPMALLGVQASMKYSAMKMYDKVPAGCTITDVRVLDKNGANVLGGNYGSLSGSGRERYANMTAAFCRDALADGSTYDMVTDFEVNVSGVDYISNDYNGGRGSVNLNNKGWVDTNTVSSFVYYPQTLMVRYENEDGTWDNYGYAKDSGGNDWNGVWKRCGSKGYGWAGQAGWSRPADTVYQGASIPTYEVSDTVTKYVSVYRQQYQQVINVRYENADGTWGPYQEKYAQTLRYGGSVPAFKLPATEVYQTATTAGWSVSGAKTVNVDVYRKNIAIKYDGNGSTSGSAWTDVKVTNPAPTDWMSGNPGYPLAANGFLRSGAAPGFESTIWKFMGWHENAGTKPQPVNGYWQPDKRFGWQELYDISVRQKGVASEESREATMYAIWDKFPEMHPKEQTFYEGFDFIGEQEILGQSSRNQLWSPSGKTTAKDLEDGDVTERVKVVKISYPSFKKLDGTMSQAYAKDYPGGMKGTDKLCDRSGPTYDWFMDMEKNAVSDEKGIPLTVTASFTDRAGNTVTEDFKVYVKYNHYPAIESPDRYFSYADAKAGKITKDVLIKKSLESGTLKISDKETPGTRLTVDLNGFDAGAFKNTGADAKILVTYSVKDDYGPEGEGKVTYLDVPVYIMEDSVGKVASEWATDPRDARVRFVSQKTYERNAGKKADDLTKDTQASLNAGGGLNVESLWYQNADYSKLIQKSFAKTTGDIYVFDKEKADKARDYIINNSDVGMQGGLEAFAEAFGIR